MDWKMGRRRHGKHWRKVHIGDQEWRYHIGSWHIVVRGPEGERLQTDHSEITGWDHLALERADWKGGYPEIKPSAIKAFIQERFDLVA